MAASGSDVLRFVDVPVVSNEDCNKEYRAVTDKDPILDEQVRSPLLYEIGKRGRSREEEGKCRRIKTQE